MTAATKTTGRQRRVTARKTTQVARAAMRIAWVAPSVLKTRLHCVQPGVRWAANQCGIVRSPSTLPLPSLVTSSPRPTMMPSNQHPGHHDRGGGAAVAADGGTGRRTRAGPA